MPKTDSPTCVFCHEHDSKLLYACTDIFGNHWEIHECLSCGAIFLSPHPTPEQLAQAYDESYYGEGEEKFEGLVERIINGFRNQRAGRLAKLLNKNGKVLDLGCGNGNFLAALGKRGTFELHGLELAGGSAERAKRVEGLQLHIGELEVGLYPPHSFDGITLFHVFEHLTAPKETLEIIQKILRPGGYLIMSFPNIGSWQARYFKNNWLHLDPPRHLFFFRTKRFKTLMEDYGFEVVKEGHFSPEYNPFGSQQSVLNLWTKKRDLLYEHLKGNSAYTAGYSKATLTLQRLFFMFSFPLFVVVDAIEALFKQSGTVEFVLRKKR